MVKVVGTREHAHHGFYESLISYPVTSATSVPRQTDVAPLRCDYCRALSVGVTSCSRCGAPR